MNILFLADPGSIHDMKWMEYIASKNVGNVFLLPRKIHHTGVVIERITTLDPIPNFSIARFLHTIATAIRIRGIVRAHSIDLIHILYAEPNALWCLFRNFFSRPMIISSRGTDVLVTIPRTFKKNIGIDTLVAPAYKKAFEMADWVTGTSIKQLSSIAEFSGRSLNTSVIRTGVDLTRLLSDTSDFFPSNLEVPYILFPRYIRPIYNHEFCLEAIDHLPMELKKRYTMVFIGKDSGEIQYQLRLEESMNRMHEVSFLFLPKLDQEAIFELYKRASLVIMTPLSDGSPVSAMEALACGARVVLGPLEYDNELFDANVHRLRNWNALELAKLISQALDAPNSQVSTEYLSLIDRNNEMEKMLGLYELVAR